MQARQAPAIIGACGACDEVGTRVAHLKTTVYLGSHRFLGPSSIFRTRWAAAFPQLASEKKSVAKMRTDSEIRRAGRRVEDKRTTPDDAGFYGVSILAKKLPYLPTHQSFVSDPMHLMTNVGKASRSLAFVFTRGSFAWW